jgi:phosphoribosylaminoimidazole-succinocarboxamide synthase
VYTVSCLLMTDPGLIQSDLPWPNKRQGKVRDVYDLPSASPTAEPRLLIVATDRISAFDVVMPTPIRGKGQLLTEISTRWFEFIRSRGLARTHLLSTNVEDLPLEGLSEIEARRIRRELEGRITIACRCRVVPIECVVRGYLEGSGWKEYHASGRVCGVALPTGLRQCDRLPEPIFTPATKAPQGEHDENITFERACELVGVKLMSTLRDQSLAIYRAAAEHAQARGILIADTKFEFGLRVDASGRPLDDQPILIDEALTPDSSRFWPASDYAPGRAQRSYDKQYLREYLESLVSQGHWNKQAPGPVLPPGVVSTTLDRYREARDRLLA